MSGYIHGGHIRATLRCTRLRRKHFAGDSGVRWSMELRNLNTNEVIASDNGWADREAAMSDAARLVEAARLAWSYGLRQRDLGR